MQLAQPTGPLWEDEEADREEQTMDELSGDMTRTEVIDRPAEKELPYRARIVGRVEPIEWDDADHVTRVCIVVDEDETEYEVFENSRGRELVHLVGETVMARGLITSLKRGVFEIRVADYARV